MGWDWQPSDEANDSDREFNIFRAADVCQAEKYLLVFNTFFEEHVLKARAAFGVSNNYIQQWYKIDKEHATTVHLR